MRRVIALAVGLVVSTLLLGGGWLWSTLRERDSRVSEARERLVRTADAVRAAVDESLEELREREDQRPFYLYNHFYSPPDVLAISDPVARSPLGRPPRDRRIVGYFQIGPDGRLRTPYAPAGAPLPPSAERLGDTVTGDAFAPLVELATGDDRGTVLASPASPGALTLDLDRWGAEQAHVIQQAQAGSAMANAALIERGRQVPRISRRDVSWEELEEHGRAARRPSERDVHTALERARPAVEACTRAAPLTVRVSVRGDGRTSRIEVEGTRDAAEVQCIREALSSLAVSPFDAPPVMRVSHAYRQGPRAQCEQGGCDAQAVIPPGIGLDNMVRREAEVDYTPMRFRHLGGELILHRVVSHGGASIVQGVLLDRDHLARRWIPAVVRRRVERGDAPRVVERGRGECAVRRPAASVLPAVELCFSPAMVARATAPIDAELGWQLGALAALWIMALLAAAAIVASARRAEALSRQKSAFVSAVSHELRTPLTTLRMHAEMLEEGLVSDERRPKVHAELVRESVRLARLVDNVLSLSRIEEGQRRIRPSEGDLRAHVREVVEGHRRFVVDRGFDLSGPEDAEPLEARFDAQAVEQILVNLLDNAVKYGAGEERSIEVDVGLIEGAPSVLVRDRGPGIEASEREKVFERFHRVEREETAHAPGTGIGLALVAELAQAHGGEASVHPREGGGLEVRVRLGPRGS